MKFPRYTGIILILATIGLLVAVNAGHLSRLPFDHHGFRQTQTLSTIEIYAEQGIDPLHPRTNYEGEPGTFVLEFPIFQMLAALLYRIFGEHLVLIRLLNIFITLGSAAMVVLITRRFLSGPVALLAGFIYLTAPLNDMYMSAILFDPLCILMALGCFYCALGLLQGEKDPWWLRRIGLMSLAIMVGITKALYLFPVLVLIAVLGGRRRAERWKTAALLIAAMVPSGICFLLWNWHCNRVNGASPFTAGLEPTSLLGFSSLFTTSWYVTMGKRLLGECIGPLGGILVLIGWCWAGITALRSRRLEAAQLPLIITLLTVAGYWLCFPNINFPHNYYSLIMVPFLSIAAAMTIMQFCEWLKPAKFAGLVFLLLGLATGGASAAFFLDRRGFPEPATMLTLWDRGRGAFHHGDYAMLFMAESLSPFEGNRHEIPHALYAIGLRGSAWTVADGDVAQEFWKEYRPDYRHLHYVVFYGLPPVPEITQEFSKVVISNATDQIYGFEPKD